MIDSDDLDGIRRYLLEPSKRIQICKGRVLVIKSFDDIWPLLIDKTFLYIHFKYDEN